MVDNEENMSEIWGLFGRTYPTRLYRLVVGLAILYMVVCWYNRTLTGGEGYSNNDPAFVIKRDQDIYDSFYASIYDTLYEPQADAKVIADFILSFTQANPRNNLFLDVGCGTGEQMAYLTQRGFMVYGLDPSEDMVATALERHPKLAIKVGSVLTPMAYDPATFSHILCTGTRNPLYTCKDKRTFFDHCYRWLIPNGYLVVQLVDPAKFDPVPPAAKSALPPSVSTKKEGKPRVTHAEIQFNDFQYRSSYTFGSGDTREVVVKETFTSNTSGQGTKVRQNEERLYMEPVDKILAIARKSGFIVHGQTNLEARGDEHQYIYLLERPN